MYVTYIAARKEDMRTGGQGNEIIKQAEEKKVKL
jgi:hypothetical protein